MVKIAKIYDCGDNADNEFFDTKHSSNDQMDIKELSASILEFGSDSETSGNPSNKRNRVLNRSLPDNMWPPHFHPHNQEWRVRYRYRGAMRVKAISCKKHGHTVARGFVIKFVEKWQISGRPLAKQTKRSRLSLACLDSLFKDESTQESNTNNSTNIDNQVKSHCQTTESLPKRKKSRSYRIDARKNKTNKLVNKVESPTKFQNLNEQNNKTECKVKLISNNSDEITLDGAGNSYSDDLDSSRDNLSDDQYQCEPNSSNPWFEVSMLIRPGGCTQFGEQIDNAEAPIIYFSH